MDRRTEVFNISDQHTIKNLNVFSLCWNWEMRVKQIFSSISFKSEITATFWKTDPNAGKMNLSLSDYKHRAKDEHPWKWRIPPHTNVYSSSHHPVQSETWQRIQTHKDGIVLGIKARKRERDVRWLWKSSYISRQTVERPVTCQICLLSDCQMGHASYSHM